MRREWMRADSCMTSTQVEKLADELQREGRDDAAAALRALYRENCVLTAALGSACLVQGPRQTDTYEKR